MDDLTISISQLKARPSKAISKAEDYPVVIKSRNQVKAYLMGKEFFYARKGNLLVSSSACFT